MVWTIDYAAEAERDFELIFEYLFQSYRQFGTAPEDALRQAAARVDGIRSAADRLAGAPHRGTLRDDIKTGLRNVTIERAIYWFTLDEQRQRVTILAVFFGGQDHVRQMLIRLLGSGADT